MSISTEKVTLQVTFQKEKLEALRFYMSEKELTVLCMEGVDTNE